MTDPRLLDWGGSGCAIREIAAYGARRAAEIGAENVYNFSIGSPSIDPPPCVGKAIERLLHTVPPTLLHAYAPAQGLPEVREAVAAYLNRTFAMDYRAEDIFMTDGASAALSVLARALLSPGDEAVALAPFFSEYRVFAEQTGAALRVAPCLPDSFQPDLAALESAVTPRTALVILNSPNNPSGVVYTRESLAAVCALLERQEREYGHPIYLLADEPYRELVYGGAEVPFLPAMYADAVYCYSFSKSLSLPGERVGFLALAPRAAEHDRRRGGLPRTGLHLRVLAVPARRRGVPRQDGGPLRLCGKPRPHLRRAHGAGLFLCEAGRRVLPLPPLPGAGLPRLLPPRDGARHPPRPRRRLCLPRLRPPRLLRRKGHHRPLHPSLPRTGRRVSPDMTNRSPAAARERFVYKQRR